MRPSEANLRFNYLSILFYTQHPPSFNLPIMHTSTPYSPDTKAYVSSSLDAWNKFFSATNSSSDSDSSHQRFMSPENSGSPSEDTDSDTMYTMAHMPDLPPQFRESFKDQPLSHPLTLSSWN